MKYKKTTLPNGLRLITVPMPGSLAATALVMVEAGSNYETKELNGLSHFLEHMLFKGTEKRPSSQHISVELESLGAQHNAFTSNEFTGYWAKGENRHLPKLLEILADMYLNPTLPEEELEKERGVIIQEIRMYEDQPQSKVGEVFTELLYGDTPAGRPIAGPIANIKRFTRKDFIDYRKKYYVSDATTIIIAGDIDEQKIKKEVESLFKNIPKRRRAVKPKQKESQSKPALAVHKKKTDQTHVIIGFRAFDVFDKRVPALQVLAAILGRGMSSRLFHKLRNEMGACYYVGARIDDFADHGYFYIATGIDGKRIEEVTRAILMECIKIMREPIPAEELKKAKEYICGRLLLGLETSDSLAEFFGTQEVIKGMVETPEEIERDIRAVTAEEVQSVAREVFRASGLNMAVVGDVKNTARLRRLLVI